jgi:ATP-dependent exoDNAse (exonuclease V) beta subunit
VWWAPSALGLAVEENVGLKQQKLLAVDERGERSEAGIRAHAVWQTERARVRAAASAPTVRVVTATEHALASAETLAVAGSESVDVALERVDGTGPRPHGKRFGTLVHATLATVDLAATPADVAELAAIEARLLGAPPDEADAAVACVVAALAHPLLRRAARATRLARETPLGLVLPDGTLVEGVVDAAFDDGDGWTVVDFKTDVELAARLPEYQRQVALYARAMAHATGRPARAVLLQL